MKKDSIVKALSGIYTGSKGLDDGYYVYMLCSKKDKTPFYIGKGTNDRVWSHENDTKAFEKAIKDELKAEIIANSDKLSKEEINALIENRIPSDKCAEISRLLKSDELDPVIVKYGLTKSEAFMAESALINMYNYTGKKPLTNIVNGHMSNREKFNRARKTEALSLSAFQKQCAIEEEAVSSLDTAGTGGKKINVAFIKINNLYQHCKNEQNTEAAIYDATRGYWSIDKKHFTEIDYVFALYQSQVVGIYPLNRNENCWKARKDIGQIPITDGIAEGADNNPCPTLPFNIRVRECYWHNKSVEAAWDYKAFIQLLTDRELEEFQASQLRLEKKCNVPKTFKDFEDKYKTWAGRYFFEIQKLTEHQKSEYEAIEERYLYKLMFVSKDAYKTKYINTRCPVTFNFKN